MHLFIITKTSESCLLYTRRRCRTNINESYRSYVINSTVYQCIGIVYEKQLILFYYVNEFFVLRSIQENRIYVNITSINIFILIRVQRKMKGMRSYVNF